MKAKERPPLPHSTDSPYHFILPSFFNLVTTLHQNGRDFGIVFRTFGIDLEEVCFEFNRFCEGKHPLSKGILLDGSDGGIDRRVSLPYGTGHWSRTKPFDVKGKHDDGISLTLVDEESKFVRNVKGAKQCLQSIENVHKDTSSTKWLLSGSWLDGVDVLRQGNPCRWEFDSNFENSKGSWTADSSAKKLNSWDLVRDNYLKLAFKRDVNTLWRGGKMVFTDRLSNNDVQLLLNRHLSPCVIPADATGGCCESCGAIASRQEQAVLLAPPRHLTLTLKRAEYDATAKRAVKKLCTVNFPPKIIVPALPGDCDTKRVGSVIAGRRDYEYRLYAVVMHAGRSASAGHYFAFARPSSEVHAEDQNWTRFNDMKVTSVTLEKMCSIARDHPENTCYFMIYHLVGPLSKEAKNEDETEDEEMLKLALAMSKQNDSNEHSTELSSKIPVEGEDASSLSEEERGKTLRYQKLEDVENENSKFFFGEFEHRTTKLYVDQIKRRSALVLNSSTE
eukprot:g15168.t1